MPTRTLLLLLAAVALVAALAMFVMAPRLAPGLRAPARAPLTHLPALDRVSTWHNSAALSVDAMAGHPVALLLWSDTDPRGLAALPVVDAWFRAFGPLGVHVVAVHEPEFAFASDSAVTVDVIRRLGLALPVADDATALLEAAEGGMAEGPHLIVADGAGLVVVDTVGDLVAGGRALERMVASANPDAPGAPGVDASLPEGVRSVGLGAGRVEDGPLRGVRAGHEQVFTAQFRYEEGGRAYVPYPVGGWRTGAEGITATRGGAATFVAIRYSAARAGVVLSPPPGGSARVWILRDDRWPGADERDEDVVADSRGASSVLVTTPRIFWIDRGSGARVLKLSPESPGVTVHSFVFTGTH